MEDKVIYGKHIKIDIQKIEAGPWHGYEIHFNGYPLAFTQFCASTQTEDWEKASLYSIFLDIKQMELLMGVFSECLVKQA